MPGFLLEARHFYVFVQVEYFQKTRHAKERKTLQLKHLHKKCKSSTSEIAINIFS